MHCHVRQMLKDLNTPAHWKAFPREHIPSFGKQMAAIREQDRDRMRELNRDWMFAVWCSAAAVQPARGWHMCINVHQHQ